MPEIERHVFICGLHRSGTTMIERYLARHYDVSVLRADVPENEGQHLQTVFPTALKYGGPGKFAFHPGIAPDKARRVQYPQHRADILEQWQPYMVGKSSVLLEKSPIHIVQIDWLARVFPNAQFIVVIRHPVAVSNGTKNWYPSLQVADLLAHWDTAHTIAQQELKEDCTILNYEAFCENPAEVADAIASKVNITKRFTENQMDGPEPRIINQNPKYLRDMETIPPPSKLATTFGYTW